LCWPHWDAYADYLSRKLDRHFTNPALTPLARLQAFVDGACQGVERYDFSRGCLVGNLGQEAGCLDVAIQTRLEDIFLRWEGQLAACLQLAADDGAVRRDTDCAALAHAFWIGWEGAILRARLMRSTGADARLFPVVSQGPRLIVSPIYSHSV
jgi:TetR/AcrR family transcriptional repressor of nem operon